MTVDASDGIVGEMMVFLASFEMMLVVVWCYLCKNAALVMIVQQQLGAYNGSANSTGV